MDGCIIQNISKYVLYNDIIWIERFRSIKVLTSTNFNLYLKHQYLALPPFLSKNLLVAYKYSYFYTMINVLDVCFATLFKKKNNEYKK